MTASSPSPAQNLKPPIARVRRDGHATMIAAVDLVPGDVLLLEAGDRIPANVRVLHAHATESATPLQVQLDTLGKRLAAAAGIVVSLISVIGVMRGDDLVRTPSSRSWQQSKHSAARR